jgi:hypothetical protein
MAIIGYGSQGHAQSLNMRDQGLNVVVGVRKNGQSWKDAQEDGWVPGKTLFEVDEAISKGTIIMNLLSDAAQSETWPAIKPQITKGKVHLLLLMLVLIADYHRLFTFPTVSPRSSRTKPRSMSQPMSMSFSSLLKDPAELSEPSLRRVVVSTLPLPSSKMSPETPRRGPLLLVSELDLVTYMRQLSKRRSILTCTVSVVA